MARWEKGSRTFGNGDIGRRELGAEEQGGEGTVKILREVGEGFLLAVDDEVVWRVVRELYRLDIGNMTPVQALVTLNEWQGRLKA